MKSKRLIEIGKNITLSPKILPGVGLREIILLFAAVIQAVYFTFSVERLPLGVRLTLAMLIAIPILVITVVPFHGLTFERWLWQQLRGALEPKLYRHTTADLDHARLRADDTPDLTEETPTLPRPVGAAAAGALALDAPNLGVVVFAFFCLLMVASVMAFATHSSLPLP